MKFLNRAIELFDSSARIFLDQQDLKSRREKLNADVRNYTSATPKFIYEAYDSIDTKTTAVLTHVSVMIAVTGVLFNGATGWTRLVFGAEVLGYVVLTLFCLRFLMEHSHQRDDLAEIVRREALLDLTIKLTFFVSVFLIGTVVFELAAK